MAFVQYMHSGQVGAPQMSGASGAEGQILQVLDACLITGFNPQTASKVEIVNGAILITFGIIHGYKKLQYITISGADDPNFNGVKRILAVTDTTITIALGSITVLTGTISTKITPLDWESIFGTTDSKKRAYRSKNMLGTRTVIYLDCNLYGTGYGTTPFKKAKVDLCRDMVTLGDQIDSYTKLDNDNYKDGLYQLMQAFKNTKSTRPDTTNNSWVVVGDGNFFYFFVDWNDTTNDSSYGRTYNNTEAKIGYFFGDVDKLSQNDNFNFVCGVTEYDVFAGATPNATGVVGTNSAFTNALNGAFNDSTNYHGYFVKDITGITNMDKFTLTSCLGAGTSRSGFRGDFYPNPLTYGLTFTKPHTVSSAKKIGRASLPFVYTICEAIDTLANLDKNVVNNFLILRVADSGVVDNTYTPYLAFDLGA